MPITDEDLLIDTATRQRKSHKRGANLFATLTLAAVFAAVGWFLLFWLRPLIKSVPFLPLGTVTTSLLVIGLIAFAIAGLLIAGALFFANPLTRWGDAIPGACPQCGKRALRQEKVEYTGWEEGHPEARHQEGPARPSDPVWDLRLLIRRRYGHQPKGRLSWPARRCSGEITRLQSSG